MAPPENMELDQLAHLQQVWESHAKTDPLWAISSHPSKRGRKWNVEEFFTTGENEIRRVFEMLDSRGVAVERTAALDFGCGVGRVTQALARRFASVCGVDISPTMIEMAKSLNQYPDRCRYVLNAADDLRQLADQSFAFIYSIVVLQHIPPQIARRYILEFGRLAQPGGIVMFQLTSDITRAPDLPPDAWAASIQCENKTRIYECDSRHSLKVSVQNASNAIWRFDHARPLMLGNHWLSADLAMLRMDDGRTPLPNPVAPRQAVELSLDIHTPAHPGVYVLELDLVQEGVSWFKDKGSPTARIEVVVSAEVAAPTSATGGNSAEAIDSRHDSDVASSAIENYSMHCIPRDEVIELIENAGLQVKAVLESGHGGAGYEGYVYILRKPQRDMR